jgi:hypothetical protein
MLDRVIGYWMTNRFARVPLRRVFDDTAVTVFRV